MSSIEKVKTILQLWTSLALHTRMRDRSVKVLQYGCQMLIGFYGPQLKPASLAAFSTLRRMSSNSRKAFWLLKSLNHVGTIISMIEGGLRDKSLADQLDFIEQIFLVFYYWYESEIYFARAGMMGLDEDTLDPWCNWTWLGGDVAFLLAGLLRLHDHVKRRAGVARQLEELTLRDGDFVDGDVCTICTERSDVISYSLSHARSGFGGIFSTGGDVQIRLSDHPLPKSADEKLSLIRTLQQMDQETFDKQLTVWIGVLELGVSLHYVDFYKFVFRKHISEMYVGAMGVASSTLILYEGLLAARRQLP